MAGGSSLHPSFPSSPDFVLYPQIKLLAEPAAASQTAENICHKLIQSFLSQLEPLQNGHADEPPLLCFSSASLPPPQPGLPPKGPHSPLSLLLCLLSPYPLSPFASLSSLSWVSSTDQRGGVVVQISCTAGMGAIRSWLQLFCLRPLNSFSLGCL